MGWNSKTGRPNSFPEDTTDLNGPTIQVQPRIAWLLRTSRLDSEFARPSDFMKRVRDLGRPSIAGGPNDVETRGRRLTAEVITTYEQVLDLRPGKLLGPCDALCRSFETGGLRHSSPMTREQRWDELVRLEGRFQDGAMTGGDWLSYSNLINRPDGDQQFPSVQEEWTHRLVTEMVRSVGPAYYARMEAISRLLQEKNPRRIAITVVEDVIAEKGAQGTVDAVAVLGDAPRGAALREVLRIFTTTTAGPRRGAALAIHQWGTLGHIGADVREAVGRAAVSVAGQGTPDALSAAAVVAPFVSQRLTVSLQQRARAAGEPTLPPRRTARPPMLGRYVDAAVRYSDAPGDRMIERLLQEALADDDSGRRHHALSLISVSPYGPAIADVALGVCRGSTDPVARRSAARMLDYLADARHQPGLVGLLDDPDPVLQGMALNALAHSSGVPPDIDLHKHFIHPQVAPTAIYAAGMSGHPDVQSAMDSRFASSEIRQRAAWWLRHGPRVAPA